ncbi:lysozyme family protein [Phytohalomonas tamaricis]|uniref:hypothetical protein n=1 Tax=Phytohalomonas tamaricis TaxID=2081032 RepID=UPI00131A2D6A|nr:hypothetical protein [Phytohalomonas tamaricis]
MLHISPNDVGGVNVCSFLDLISWSEGTAPGPHPLTRDNGYDAFVTGSDGPEVF